MDFWFLWIGRVVCIGCGLLAVGFFIGFCLNYLFQKLKEIHADYLQGYLFGRPCDKNQFLNQFICKGIN